MDVNNCFLRDTESSTPFVPYSLSKPTSANIDQGAKHRKVVSYVRSSICLAHWDCDNQYNMEGYYHVGPGIHIPVSKQYQDTNVDDNNLENYEAE